MRTLDNKHWVHIEHALPGRLRIRLSHQIMDEETFCSKIFGHSGIHQVNYNDVSRSVLVHFEPEEIEDKEIVLRVSLAYSGELNLVPIIVRHTQFTRTELGDLEAVSGVLLGINSLLRFFKWGKAGGILEWIATSGTILAILNHAIREHKEKGSFDPEVLSLLYLLTSLKKPNQLKALWLTWAASFGRHLIYPPDLGVEVIPSESKDPGSDYEVTISPVEQFEVGSHILNFIPRIIKSFLGGDFPDLDKTVWEGMRDVSEHHGHVLHGLGGDTIGIPVHMEKK